MAQIAEIEECLRYHELLHSLAKTRCEQQEQIDEIYSNVIFLKQQLKLALKEIQKDQIKNVEDCIPFTAYNKYEFKTMNIKINPKTLQLYIDDEELSLKTVQGKYNSQYYSFYQNGIKYKIYLNQLKNGLYNQNAGVKKLYEIIAF
ncbi:Hypothetical_protein [Hexamita inflata]|uniref:Hypothetical_protein n=1 Tax=Hexamita inflata TaxID=28002 RepID=A0ABP1GX55_9EUKA